MRRKVLLLVITAALGAMMVGVGLLSTAHSISTARTIRVVLKDRTTSVVDLPPRGSSQGDMRIVHAPLFNRTETKRVGTFDAVCTLTLPPANGSRQEITLCDYTSRFSDGEITLETVNAREGLDQPPREDAAAVTGGTGTFQNARGELHLLVPRGEERDLVFHLIP